MSGVFFCTNSGMSLICHFLVLKYKADRHEKKNSKKKKRNDRGLNFFLEITQNIIVFYMTIVYSHNKYCLAFIQMNTAVN